MLPQGKAGGGGGLHICKAPPCLGHPPHHPRAGPEPPAAAVLPQRRIPPRFALQNQKVLLVYFFAATGPRSLPQPVPRERKSVTRSPAVCKTLSEPPFTFSSGPGGGKA